MPSADYAGEPYIDDRMFVLHVCKCTVVTLPDGLIETKIYHEDAPHDHIWCLAAYSNTAQYPLASVDHFSTQEAAQEYLESVEPAVPRVSLGGRGPTAPLRYEQWSEWKVANRLKDYEYQKLYSEGGVNRQEIVISRRR